MRNLWQTNFWHLADNRPATEAEARSAAETLGLTLEEDVDDGLWLCSVNPAFAERIERNLERGLGYHETANGVVVSIEE